ncbi:fibronectin type III domain-containing protein [Paenibacillus sp. NPDC056579]|uniref:fibronectin type III domain-containing protein n=1 Tax=Paenibacillus sp. NPDC056579 TaxID=3345871 RepID=UPI003675DA68
MPVIVSLLAIAYLLWPEGSLTTKDGGDAEMSTIPFQTDAAHAVIDIDTRSEKPIPYGMRGVNNETSNKEAFINHKQLIDEVNRYGRLGFIRWPGGTNSDVFNWRTGMPDIDYGAFSFGPDGTIHGPHTTFRLGQAKGGEHITDYVELLRKTNTKAMITVNTTRQTAEQAGDLAKYLYDNRVPVIYFELGNEIMFFTSSSGKNTAYYKTASDYLDRVRGHFDAIKRNYPGAQVIISVANSNKPEMAKAFDKDVYQYPDPYWDGITFHRFEGDGRTVAEAVKSANSALEKLVPLIDTNYVPHLQKQDTPIYLGEQGVALGGILESTQYHGIYVAESILRLSTHPNITYLAGYRLHNGIFNTNAARGGANASLLMEDAYQRGETVDPSTLAYDSYYHASSAGLRVVDGAVNYSSAVWRAQVTGGAESPKAEGSMPALYAAAYKGENGTRYLVITNKSAQEQQVSVQMNGKPVLAAMKQTYTTSNDPAARNTAIQKEQVAVRSEATGNPVTVAPYSVTRLEWDGEAPDAPREAWLYAAEPGHGSVHLQWYAIPNASGYKIKYGTESKAYTYTINAGQALEYDISGLTEGRTYYFSVAAYNESGESPASNEVPVMLSAPDIPLLRHAYAERSGKVVLEWQSVAGAAGYRILYGKAPGVYAGTIEAGNNAGWLVSGLDNDTRYYFSVRAYNALGESRNSTELEAVPRSLLPLAPRDLSIKKEDGPSISMQWKPARTEVEEHHFEDGTAGPFHAEGWNVEPHPDRSRRVNGYRAQEGGSEFAVWSSTPQGNYEGEAVLEWTDGVQTGQAGIAVRFLDQDNHIRFVYDRTDKQYKLIKVALGKEQVLAAKQANGDPLRLYLFLTVDGNHIYAKLNNEGTILRATDSSPAAGKFALYSSGTGAWFDSVRMYSPNTRTYTVYRSIQQDTGFEAIAMGIKDTAFTDSGLPEGTRYYYKVKAVNELGESHSFSNAIRKN